MQLCSLEGELHARLPRRTLQPALANVSPAAFARDTHRSLLDVITRTEPMYTREAASRAPHTQTKVSSSVTFDRRLDAKEANVSGLASRPKWEARAGR